ncbi:DMT family transporter [Acidisarcina polymorpha]|uniref:DMT family transporter n=1 Tax=Acidisarcina polymorpha TaxID=2211140 RepID=UPI001F489EDE|nr:DMT family transporter [Acidisarcina polymorpha]
MAAKDPQSGKSQRLLAHLLLLAVVVVWGGSFVLVKDALSDISPLLFNLIRMALASVCLIVIYRRHLPALSAQTLAGGAVAGFFLALGYQFQTSGLALTTPSKSAFLTGLTVVLVPLLSVMPAVRAPGSLRPGWNAYAGAAVALLGITLLTAPGVLSRAGGWRMAGINRGDLLTLGCALSFAFHLLTLAHLAKRIHFEQLALLQIGFCTLFMGISLPLLEHPRIYLTLRLLVALLVSAVLSTAAAFTIQSWAQQHLAASHTALILAGEPVFAWITSLLFLHEGLGQSQALGALLILAGIGLTELFTAQIETNALLSPTNRP